MKQGISKEDKLYKCTQRTYDGAHCHYCSYDYLFTLGMIVCGRPDEHPKCKYLKEIKNYNKKIKNYLAK